MAELFGDSGQSADLALSPPTLQGIFIPGIDNSNMADGLGIVIPWGSGGTVRKYQDYGPSSAGDANETQLQDLASYFLPGGDGIAYNFEGLMGPQGPPGRDGLPGVTTVIGFPSSVGVLDVSTILEALKNWSGADNTIPYSSTAHVEWGETWVPMPIDTYLTWNESAVDEDGSFMLVASDDGIFVSTDSGANWTKKTPATPAEEYKQVTCADAVGKAVVLGDTSRLEGKIWVTSDSGVTWSQVTVS